VRIAVRVADITELDAILTVQRQAFARVARLLGVDAEALPPLTETVTELEQLFRDGTRFFVATDDDGRVVGSVRATTATAEVEIGRLVVADGHERQGIASRLMDALESEYAGNRLVLFTGAQATGPLALYHRRGYTEFRRERVNGIELVWLELTERAETSAQG
jgi:GNAT superfamily N-acetyltransferase